MSRFRTSLAIISLGMGLFSSFLVSTPDYSFASEENCEESHEPKKTPLGTLGRWVSAPFRFVGLASRIFVDEMKKGVGSKQVKNEAIQVLPLDDVRTFSQFYAHVSSRIDRETASFGLIRSLESDSFFSKKPFEFLDDWEPIQRVVNKGIEKFERRIFRSKTNVLIWNSEYDFLSYEIKHPDGSRSLIFAWKFADDDSQKPVLRSSPDIRSTKVSVVVGVSQDRALRYEYHEGMLFRRTPYAQDKAHSDLSEFLRESLEAKELFELKNPNEIITP